MSWQSYRLICRYLFVCPGACELWNCLQIIGKDNGKSDKSTSCGISSYATEKSLERQFAEKTTCHGLRFIAESSRSQSKMMWTCVVMTALGCLIYGITSLARAYSSYPSYMSVRFRVSTGINCHRNNVKRRLTMMVDKWRHIRKPRHRLFYTSCISI